MRNELCNSIKHLNREWYYANWCAGIDDDGECIWDDDTDEMQKMMYDNLRQLLEVFSSQGHSGFSANYALGLFMKLADFKPITPLTGDDSEWVKPWGENDGTMQNIRCSRVFKDKDGRTYDISGIVWKDKDGLTYTSRESAVDVVFPYMPKTEYRDEAEREQA